VTATRWTAEMPSPASPGVLVDREGTRLTLPVRMNSWSSRIDLLWLLVWALAEFVLLRALIERVREGGGPPRATPGLPWLVPFLVLMTAAGLFLMWRVQWLLFGREVLELRPGAVRFRREGLWKDKWQDLPVQRIRAVRLGHVHEDLIYPSWGRRFVGKDAGSVVLTLVDRNQVLGRGLREDDARRVVDAIQRHVRTGPPGGGLAS
jgi:hypothetical protein